MAMNPNLAGAISYDPSRSMAFPMGATALRKGDLFKFTAGLAVPVADNDENLEVWVALAYAPANGTLALNTGVTGVPLVNALVRMAYTGSAPTIGAAYGVSDARTLDQANTTQILLTALAVDTDQAFVIAQQYSISA